MKLLVTGTPGVGKTTLSSLIAKKDSISAINIGDLIKNLSLYSRVSKKYDTLIYDPAKVKKALNKRIEGMSSFVIDTHDPESVSFIDFDLIVVMKMDCKTLSARYRQRGYSERKAAENLEAEIMEVVYNDVIEYMLGEDVDEETLDRKVLVIEGSGESVSPEEMYARIKEKLCRK